VVKQGSAVNIQSVIRVALMTYLLCVVYRDNGWAVTLVLALFFIHSEIVAFILRNFTRSLSIINELFEMELKERERRSRVVDDIFKKICEEEASKSEHCQ